jgi:hypothetical protein
MRVKSHKNTSCVDEVQRWNITPMHFYHVIQSNFVIKVQVKIYGRATLQRRNEYTARKYKFLYSNPSDVHDTRLYVTSGTAHPANKELKHYLGGEMVRDAEVRDTEIPCCYNFSSNQHLKLVFS